MVEASGCGVLLLPGPAAVPIEGEPCSLASGRETPRDAWIIKEPRINGNNAALLVPGRDISALDRDDMQGRA
jgi:hypothetical protein